MKKILFLFTALIICSSLHADIYTDQTAEFSYNPENPGHLDIKEVEVTKTSSKTLTFKITFNEDSPRKSEFRNITYLYLDVDGSVKTGQASNYDSTFCYDNVLAIARPADSFKFEHTGNSAYSNIAREDNEIEVKKIDFDKNQLTIEVSTKLFIEVPSIKFNICTSVGVMDEKNSRKDEVTQRKTIDWLSQKKGLEFKMP